MSLSKRGEIWWYDFRKNKRRHQGSTGQTNKNKARDVEDKIKTDIAMAKFGMTPQKKIPLVKDFFAANGVFIDHIEQHAKKQSTAKQYASKCKPLAGWTEWTNLPLSELQTPLQNQYKTHRRKTIGEFTLRDELNVLRMALRLAHEWGLAPKISVTLPPEPKGRIFTVDSELEAEYMLVAPYPLKQVGIIMLEQGLRPSEVACLPKTHVDLAMRYLMVEEGKSANAQRTLRLTDRTIETIQELCDLNPDSPWLFPSRKRGSHVRPDHLSHRFDTLRESMGWNDKFVLYSFRHTFGTELAASGANPKEIMEIMGHSDYKTSQKYIHPTSEHLERAMKRKEAFAKARRGQQQVPASLQSSLQQALND